jgi:hypothetical protein
MHKMYLFILTKQYDNLRSYVTHYIATKMFPMWHVLVGA